MMAQIGIAVAAGLWLGVAVALVRAAWLSGQKGWLLYGAILIWPVTGALIILLDWFVVPLLHHITQGRWP
jgi:hypothetical protein